MADWNYQNAAHLLRRAAFGATIEEIEEFLEDHDSLASAVDAIVQFPVVDRAPPPSKFTLAFLTAADLRKQRQWWLRTMVRAREPEDALREKLVLFWHGFLCSGASKQRYDYPMAGQNGLFRRSANGNFRELVRNFNRDYANLTYLDGQVNQAGEVNENFARELLELFTLGISQIGEDGLNDPSKPNYTEEDVHQLARALTGWTFHYNPENVGVWDPVAWDGGGDEDGDGIPDDVTILGVTNNNFRIDLGVAGTADDVLKHIFDRLDDEGNHQAALFVCRKLWTYFAYPAPAPGLKTLLASFAEILVDHDYELVPVLTAMFNHDEFYSEAARTRTVKNPVDYTLGWFRTLGVKSNGKKIGNLDLLEMLDEMGMELFEPPNVAGWPGGTKWITSGTLVSRYNFARLLAETRSGSGKLRLRKLVPIGSPTTSPDDVIDSILACCGLDGSQGGLAMTAAQRDLLIDFLTVGGTKPTLDLSDDDTADARDLVRGVIAVVLQTPEAQIF